MNPPGVRNWHLDGSKIGWYPDPGAWVGIVVGVAVGACVGVAVRVGVIVGVGDAVFVAVAAGRGVWVAVHVGLVVAVIVGVSVRSVGSSVGCVVVGVTALAQPTTRDRRNPRMTVWLFPFQPYICVL